MSFGSGFGGFGQNNQQQQQQQQQSTPAFGGFGSSNAPLSTGFGSTPNTGFGTSNTTGGGLFGNNSSGFGGSGGSGGFGSTQNSAFGAKPGAFGSTPATSGGSLFGGGTATSGPSGFGGFGSAAPSTNTSGFGASNTGGGLFGANKPAFGSNTTATSNPFGGTTSTPFGGSTTSAFGAPASTALGGNTGECQGTGSVPFQPFVEKEPNSTTNQQNSFQSISFQQPYQKFSPEELRLADYAQGRRYGNQSNQPGAFGSSNFGSFGQSQPSTGFGAATGPTSNPFGSGTSGGFGTSQPATSAFGSNTATSGGLFGQNKPATGGLFGSQAQTQPSTGGLFGGGSSAPFGSGTSGGFGATNTAQGSSLFGGNNTANKPAFSFGSTAPAASSAGFGSTPASTGAFGGGGLFGNTQQQNTTTPFGQQQQQQQQPAQNNPFGGFGGTSQPASTSLFGGGNQAKPGGGLFGTTAPAATGTGLFGGSQPAANTTNPFGASTTTQNTGGLFGGQKPAATGTGLFGSSTNTQPNTGGTGLFGGFGAQNQNQNQPQQQPTGLFGNLNNNNQQKPSLFSQPQQQGGTGLFGNTGTQQQGTGLFGGGQQQQQQQQPQAQSSIFGGGSSLFGGSQQNQQNQQQPQSLTASINDSAAFGNASLFSNLASSQINNPGPLATPLSSSAKQKKTAPLPMYKLNSASTSRFSTPSKRGFGFSYSNYGTPGSVISSASSTPGATFSGSLLGGNMNRSLGKSISTSSLRRSFNAEDSILAPGAFSASPSARQYGSTGSMKKLVINRGLRSDLFSPPREESLQAPATPNGGGILKKRVSFDSSTLGATNGSMSPLKQVQNNATPTSEELGYMRPRPTTNGAKTNGATTSPEKEQVSNELAIVHEEEAPAPVAPATSVAIVSLEDQEPGQYWMKPSKAEIEAMSRDQRKAVSGFTVGREGVGHVTFSTVDLRDINLDELFDNIVVLTVRSATVYPNSAKKPPRGKGLNVPSTIALQNSWPRGKDKRTPIGEKTGPRLKKHIDRLQKVPNTKFVDYEKDTGVWSFQVDHFTTYSLDLDDETDGEGMSGFDQSTLSAPPDTPTPKQRTPIRSFDESFNTQSDADPDDTFQFKRKKILPGAFDDEELFDEEVEMADYEQDEPSFLDERSVGSQSEDGVEEPMDNDDVFVDEESVSIVDQEMAGSFPHADNTTEPDNNSQDGMSIVEDTPGGIMRARMRALKNSASPVKRNFSAGNDWAGTLTTTISPQKQDRALLKSLIDVQGEDLQPHNEQTLTRSRIVSDGRGFATSLDLMNSLFGQAKSPVKATKVSAKPKGFEWPYAKKPRTDDSDQSSMTKTDRAFHDSMRPTWGPDGTLVYAAASNPQQYGKPSRRGREKDGLLTIQKGGVVSESRDVRFAKFANEAAAEALKKHISLSVIDESDGVPLAHLTEGFSFADFCEEKGNLDPASGHEKLVWLLASVLFDRVKVPKELEQVPKAVDRLRKDKLSAFWQKLVDHTANQQISMARSPEEKAISALSGHRVADACGHLVNGKNYHLATLVAQVGGRQSMRKDIQEQLAEWQKSRVLSEFSQPIRAMYEILAGNVCVCDGTKGAPIEDRIDSFIISKRFGLDWRQAFGMRLWYGITSADDLDAAVVKFAEDIAQDFETSRPQAWYVEQKIPTIWEDQDLESREDLLWGLLKLYAFGDSDLEAIIRPENSQLSPLDTRFSWQLSRALTASGAINYSEDADDKADQATLSFASQLNNEGSWLEAVWVLLHLSSSTARAKSVQNQLAQHAGRIGSEDSETFATLVQNFKIPVPWIWEAKALYMRSVKKDPRGEVECLIRAGSFEEAHRTFAKDVAPKSIVEADYETLRVLLDGFRKRENIISEWHRGGEIYHDFLQLLDGQKKGKTVDHAVLERLLVGLPAVVKDTRNPDFMERVAIETMSGVVAKTVVALRRSGEKADLAKVLQLPLTEDKYLKHTVELSLGYYRDVMAGR